MADVAKMIEEHLQHRGNHTKSEPSFVQYLTVADKYEAHGLGVVIEELMTPAEIVKYRRGEAMPQANP